MWATICVPVEALPAKRAAEVGLRKLCCLDEVSFNPSRAFRLDAPVIYVQFPGRRRRLLALDLPNKKLSTMGVRRAFY
jgi:hypothetical protein